MKRRDFINRSALGAIGVGTVLTAKGAAGNNDMATQAPGKKPSTLPAYNGPEDGEVMTYTQKPRSGVIIGGIGAGGAELRKDGIFYNWSIANNNPKGTGKFQLGTNPLHKSGWEGSVYPYEPGNSLFFVVRYQVGDAEPAMKLLQIDEGYRVANIDMHIYEFPWLTGVERIEYKARFPFAWLKFSDPDMPVEVEMEVYSPFIPHDVKNSSLPVMNFNFKVTSVTDGPVDVTLLAFQQNQVGFDVAHKRYSARITETGGFPVFEASAELMDNQHSSFGTMGMASLSAESEYYLGYAHRHTFLENLLRNPRIGRIDHTENRNYINNDKGSKLGDAFCYNVSAIYKRLDSGTSFDHSFVAGWHFPNNYDEGNNNKVGHFYDNFFKNSTEAINYAIANRDMLAAKTHAFVDAFYDSTLPLFVLNQINSQLTTFISSGLLTKNGDFGVMEGITIHQSWGPVGTTDVNMYGGVMVTSLFPELQQATMRIHKKLQHHGGEIRHSFNKSMSEFIPAVAGVSERLDLHSQYVVMVMRDFFWTNDKVYLAEFWPSIRKALDYVLNERDLNGDQQPDMTGIMSSYDNFPMYGMAAYIQSQWLAALASAIEGAKVMGDKQAESKYRQVFEKGKKLAEEKLWNGKYFRLYNSDLKTFTVKDGAGKPVTKDISGTDEGCLTDQIIGQYAAHWSGLGNLFNPVHIKEAMKNILALSYKPKFGLRNCSWPNGKFWGDVPADIWVDQGNTCWSGVELSFAAFLLYEGLYDEALKVIETVDTRYRRNGRYFDHQEFGGHYFRPMGVWGVVNGAIGLSINQGTITFKPSVPGDQYKLFFSVPGGYGHLRKDDKGTRIEMASGKISVKSFRVPFSGTKPRVETSPDKGTVKTSVENGMLVITFSKQVSFAEGEYVSII